MIARKLCILCGLPPRVATVAAPLSPSANTCCVPLYGSRTGHGVPQKTEILPPPTYHRHPSTPLLQDMAYRKNLSAMEVVWRGLGTLPDTDVFTGNFASGAAWVA